MPEEADNPEDLIGRRLFFSPRFRSPSETRTPPSGNPLNGEKFNIVQDYSHTDNRLLHRHGGPSPSIQGNVPIS
jgi:hypothetical protein